MGVYPIQNPIDIRVRNSVRAKIKKSYLCSLKAKSICRTQEEIITNPDTKDLKIYPEI
jgi:hypothetical protein